jgi:hypothetical protein
MTERGVLNLTLLFRHIYKGLLDAIETGASLAPMQHTLVFGIHRFFRPKRRRQPAQPPPDFRQHEHLSDEKPGQVAHMP